MKIKTVKYLCDITGKECEPMKETEMNFFFAAGARSATV